MGTPDFAVRILAALHESRHEVVAVYTQPDEPKGRGKQLAISPVKQYALEHGLLVRQPKSLKRDLTLERMRATEADVIVVAAYGKILRKDVLEMKRFGCVNVHASLLPAYRGAAPIQWAVLNGERESGVTIMQMNEGLDTGDILKTVSIPLDEKETSGSLFEKLAALGGPALLSVLDEIEAGTATPVPQGETTTPYAKMLDKSMGEIDFSKSAVEIERLIRGMDPWPSAYTELQGKLLKIWQADVLEQTVDALPGTVVEVGKRDFTVAAGQGSLKILEVQPEGKKRMSADAFLRGARLEAGVRLGRTPESGSIH